MTAIATPIAVEAIPEPPTPASRPAPTSLQGDVLQSVRNAAKLGLSLLATWAVALGVRILLPRFLGPATFGAFQFADAFTTAVFVLATLGLETYVRKEVATRREHATEFFGGTLLVTLAMSAVIMVAALAGLAAAHRPPSVLLLVLVLGIAQILFNANAITSAMLHAVGAVDGLSVLNVGVKLAWGAGILAALGTGHGAAGAAVAVLAAETLRTVALAILARRHVGLRFLVNRAASGGALRASLPYYVAGLAQTVYGRLDLSIMSFLARDVEVGWYGAASTLAGMSLLMSPLIGWVLLPLTSRAAARSTDELLVVARRAMEIVLAAAFPVTLALWLGADEIVRLAFGAAYVPAVGALRILAPTFVLTYAAMVNASILIRLERGWAVTGVSLGGMALSPALNLWLVPRCLALYGDGGAGRGAAIALVVTEAYTVVALGWLLGRRALDRRMLGALGRTIGVCAAVIAADRLMQPLGIWRLPIDGALYAALAVAAGVVDVRASVAFVRGMLARRTEQRRQAAEGVA